MLLLIKALDILPLHIVIDEFHDLQLIQRPHDNKLALPNFTLLTESAQLVRDVQEQEDLREGVLEHEGPPQNPIWSKNRKQVNDESDRENEVHN